MAVEPNIEAERARDLSGACEEHGAVLLAATRANRRQAPHGLACADEHRRPLAFTIGHEVQHLVHPVAEVDVRVARRAPHRRVALGPPHPAVARGVVRVSVRLDLGDSQNDVSAREPLAEKITRHFESIACIEPLRENPTISHIKQRAMTSADSLFAVSVKVVVASFITPQLARDRSSQLSSPSSG
jgi:hypothetical protein